MSIVKKVIGKLTRSNESSLPKRVLTPVELQYAIQRERSRSDRREIPFSIIILSSPHREYLHRDNIISQIIERLRITDDVGWIDSRHLGILLPDTESDSACKVAANLQEFLAGDQRPSLEVFTYPYDGDDLDSNLEDENSEEKGQTVAKSGIATDSSKIQPQALSFAVRLPIWKRTLDIMVSFGTLVVLLPFMILVALLIKLTSKGPVFFTQWREGKDGQKFKIYKFRTMVVNAENQQDELRHLSEQNGPAFKIEKDPRLTWLGAILRKSCFDETPQFLNILKGEMTLVGPRPLPVNESQACTRWQRRRLDVTPGMTCIWQVCGSRHMEFSDWMRMDHEYIRTSGFLTDLKILFKTAVFVLFRRASV